MPSNTIEKDQAIPLKDYKAFFKEIKERILTSQVKAALAINHELINLYWDIGSKIHLKQKEEGWGAKTVENLANDLKSTFPEMKGFSLTNIKYMVQFAKEYPDFAIGQQVVAQIPWGHNILLLQKLETLQDRLWYAHKTIDEPIGISQYEAKIIESLPDELEGSLPSIEQIEQELEDRE